MTDDMIREKDRQIAELKKAYEETEELLDRQIEATYKVVKENAELKARLNAINQLTPELEKCSKLKEQQLTKAKEIIEKLLDNLTAIDGEQIRELKVVREAEQFLKELEKEIKWHKVADGDLPSEEGGWVCNQNGLPCYFDWGTEQWLDCEGTQIRTTEWCHMPHKE